MDIDIDFPTNFNPKTIFPNWVRASLVKNGELMPHPCGYYAQNIPIDPYTNLSAIPYEEAEKLGYLKIDFLHLSIYNNFQSRKEIDELLQIEPNWKLLTIPSIQKKLFQLSNHGDILDIVKPKNIEQLADVLALIRPGKKQLLKLYLAHPENTRKILYAKNDDGYSFKKSHAIAYAMVIVLQLHCLSTNLNE